MATDTPTMNPSSSPDRAMSNLENAKEMCAALGVLLNYLAADECDDKTMDTAQRVHEDLGNFIDWAHEACERATP